MSAAQERIDELIELAPSYTEAYNKVYKTPGHKASRTCPDCREFDMISGNLELLLGCEECGSGGIEDARYTRDNPGNPDIACDQCVEFAELWDIHGDELACYEWSI